MSELPQLCAHRGNAAEFPENTLPALASALELGVPFVEFDLQLSADEVPVLFHDHDLKRTTGQRGLVSDLPWRSLRAMDASEPQRFGDRFAGVTIPSLDDALALLAGHPGAQAFLELKKESIRTFGVQRVMDAVLSRLASLRDRIVIVSFERAAVEATPPDLRRGWVLRGFSKRWRTDASNLAPDYLFVNHKRLPANTELWPGAWQWCVYDVPEPEQGLAFHQRGAHLIETAAVGNYVSHPAFAEQFP